MAWQSKTNNSGALMNFLAGCVGWVLEFCWEMPGLLSVDQDANNGTKYYTWIYSLFRTQLLFTHG